MMAIKQLIHMTENTLTEKKMVMEFMFGQMEVNIQENGKITSIQGKELIYGS